MKQTILFLTGLILLFFKSNSQTTFTDARDGNVYQIVTIGTQVWMAENLKFLPSVEAPTTSSSLTPNYYVYDYSGTNIVEAKETYNYNTYGVLYNWPAAMANSLSSSINPSGIQGICPAGWHLPSDAEWTQLINYLGGNNLSVNKLKEVGLLHWNEPNEGTNESGFTALPSGMLGLGTFVNICKGGAWWSATENSNSNSWYRFIYINLGTSLDGSKEFGLSVRCIKDNISYIKDINENKYIQVYPNPTTEIITIQIIDPKNIKLQIFDMNGKCILKEELRNEINYIDVSMLIKGMYLIQIIENNQIYQKKMIKE